MDAKLDTLTASRKLKRTGMPEPQADIVVEVVNDAMTDLVTKEYLKVELHRSFTEFERKIDKRFDKIDERFDKIDERFEKIDGKFEKIEGKFGSRFEKIDADINELKLRIAELGKSQAWGFVYVCATNIAALAAFFAALQYFGADPAPPPLIFP